MLVTLKEILNDASNSDYAVAGFNVFGYEDAVMVIEAAEELNIPVILMTNRDAVVHMPIKILGNILTDLAREAKVPVCVHLDHGKSVEEVVSAIKAGFSSVMYDGSQLPLEENIKRTKEIADIGHHFGVSVEGEIGSVGYSDPSIKAKAMYTVPEEAKRFVEETGVDAVAVAVGTLHRMQAQEANIQYDRLAEIEKVVNVPLVIHGSTGVKDEDLSRLAKSKVGKVNIGTALRMAFGNTLRDEVNDKPQEFDRIKFFKKPMIEVKNVAKEKMVILGAEKR
ncbi:class II fructose-bisphosphate aldolase [Wukongibacter baidiensis]|uniref:class II fructose-bisphosphate aldolase n=1 Tax=Wukongibacter baidiensis TaxID=1723361 RepID=UPI003D7FC6A2